MELTPLEATAVKGLYSMFHANAIPAEQALEAIELMINNSTIVERCPSCKAEIDEHNLLIDTERYTANDKTGYCDSCYDPTPFYPPID